MIDKAPPRGWSFLFLISPSNAPKANLILGGDVREKSMLNAFPIQKMHAQKGMVGFLGCSLTMKWPRFDALFRFSYIGGVKV